MQRDNQQHKKHPIGLLSARSNTIFKFINLSLCTITQKNEKAFSPSNPVQLELKICSGKLQFKNLDKNSHRTHAKNIIAPLSCVLMWLLSLFFVVFYYYYYFFGLLNTKSIKLGISPDDTKFKHIYGNITYTYRSMTHELWSQKHTSGLPTRPTTKQWLFSKMEFGVY